MKGWTLTKVWKIDEQLVVAKTVEEALEIYRAYKDNDNILIRNIEAVHGDDRGFCLSYDALIKERE